MNGSKEGKPETQSRDRLLILLGAFLGVFIGIHSSLAYTVGFFIRPLEVDFGWTRTQASSGAAISFICMGVMAPIAGHLLDRFGSQRIATFSLFGLALSFALIACLTSGYWSFLLLSLLVCAFGAGTGTYTFSRLIVLNFERYRGLALGAVLTGTSVGAIVFPHLLMPLIAERGWKAGYLALAAVILLLSPIVLLLIGKSGPTDIPALDRPSALPLFRSRPFAFLGAMFLVSAFGVLGTTVQFAAMLSDSGLSAVEAAGIAALIGWGSISARIVIGWLLDTFSPPVVTALVFLLSSAGMILLAGGGMEFALIGAVLAGMAIGAEGDLLAFMVARYFPLKNYGTMLGWLIFIFNVGGAFGPLAAGYLKDTTGDYRAWLFVSGTCLIVSSGIALCLGSVRPTVNFRPVDIRPTS